MPFPSGCRWLAHLPGQAVYYRLGGNERKPQIEQRQVDHLALAALDLDFAQRERAFAP